MHIGDHAQRNPEKPALVMTGSGESVSFGELDAHSSQLARLLRSYGIDVGGHVAILLDNHPRYLEIAWAAQRGGIYLTPINWHLGPDEAGYIVRDCGARALVTSSRFAKLVGEMDADLAGCRLRLSIGGGIDGFETYEDAIASERAGPVPDETEGAWMFYSSGTTGRPKGILRPLQGAPGAEEKPVVPEPPAPDSNIPLLDELLKEEIRIRIENERTRERIQTLMTNVALWFDTNIVERLYAPEGSEERITEEQVPELVKDYALSKDLHYAETELLSGQELYESQEHMIGQAQTVVPLGARPEFLPNAIIQTDKNDVFRPITVEQPETSSWFVVWKVADKEAYAPESMSDERVRKQVVEAWRALQARPKAEARAEELADLLRTNDAPMGEVFSEVTVSGGEDSLQVQVQETGQFTWLSSPGGLQMQMFSPYPPVVTSVPGVQGTDDAFMKAVFDELEPGEVGVAVNADRTVYYVVHVMERTPSTEEDRTKFRENFLAQNVFEDPVLAPWGGTTVYQRLAADKTRKSQTSLWIDDLWKRHEAEPVSGEG